MHWQQTLAPPVVQQLQRQHLRARMSSDPPSTTGPAEFLHSSRPITQQAIRKAPAQLHRRVTAAPVNPIQRTGAPTPLPWARAPATPQSRTPPAVPVAAAAMVAATTWARI